MPQTARMKTVTRWPTGRLPRRNTAGRWDVAGSGQSPQRVVSGGVAVAPIVDPGPSERHSSKALDSKAFRPRGSLVISGLAVVLTVTAVVLALKASGLAVWIVVAGVCVILGLVLVVSDRLRWENAWNLFEHQRDAAVEWRDRFNRLESEATRTMSVLSHMSDGILMLSDHNKIVLVTDIATRLLALPPESVYVGRPMAEMVRVPEIVQAVEEARSRNIDQNVSVEIVDGSIVRPVSVRIGRIQETQPSHLLLVLRDETEAYRVEAIRREFIANVSHELKTPLAAIKGYAETVELAIEDDAESAKHFITQIETQCDRLEDLIADMMRLARAQSGKGTLLIQAIDLEKVIQQAMSTFLPVAAAKQVDLDGRGFR